MKLIVILRDPVERAYSQWRLERRRGTEPLSFEDALDREASELTLELELLLETSGYRDAPFSTSYVARGRYAEQLDRWFELFPREQVLVLLSEDLLTDPAAVMSGIAQFLDVPEWSAGELPNPRGAGRRGAAAGTRERLANEFAEPNRRLEELLGRELHWTQPSRLGPERSPTGSDDRVDHALGRVAVNLADDLARDPRPLRGQLARIGERALDARRPPPRTARLGRRRPSGSAPRNGRP